MKSDLPNLAAFERVKNSILAGKLIAPGHRDVSTRCQELWVVEDIGYLRHEVEMYALRDGYRLG